MIDFLAHWFGYVMEWCYRLIPNWPAAIALFTLLTKILLLPVSLWSDRNGLRMVAIMPQVNELKARFFGDKERIGDEQAALYKREHYHPLLSLVPLALQIIILMGLIGVIHQITDSGRAPGLGLMPVEDGGAALLMPVAAAAAAVVLGWAQNRINPLQKEQERMEQLSTNGVSVVISLVLGMFVPVGVALYWVYSNLFTIPVQAVCNLILPPKKYVDYAALEESRQKLGSLQELGKDESKELRRRGRADFKRFFKVANKRIVFYSEAAGFYKYFEAIIAELLARTNVVIHYVTSDPDDPIFRKAEANPRIQAYYMGVSRLITLFMKMDADTVIMTMPDLNTYHYKRSYVRKDVEYVYVFHGLFSGLGTLRKGALDHFDTLLTPTPGFEKELRVWNERQGLRDQKMVPCGYCVAESMAAQYDAMPKQQHAVPTALIAPSWQDGNILVSCLPELAESLLGDGWDVTVRPHPQFIRRFPAQMQEIIAACERFGTERFRFQLDFASNETVFMSDLLVTDWSNIGYEYALATRKPVLFINTPRKIVNEEWTEEDIDRYSVDSKLRDVIGIALAPEEAASRGAEAARRLYTERDAYTETIDRVRAERVYHFGESGKYGALYLIGRMVERQKAEKEAAAARESKKKNKKK